jgi:hypothetical protein
MSFPSRATLRPRYLVALLPLFFASAPSACGKSSPASSTPGGSSGKPSSCPVPPEDAGLPSFEALASGTVEGTGVSASFCNLGIYTEETGQGGPPYVLILNSIVATSSTVGAPASGTAGTVTGAVSIGSATPGVYLSADDTQCGALSFSYGVPLASQAACSAADADGPCPTGCTTNFFCESPPCCVPLATTYVFQASAPVDDASPGCSPANPALGSWTVTLTSVEQDDEGGQVSLVPHGTLDATLLGTTGNSETVTLSLTF